MKLTGKEDLKLTKVNQPEEKLSHKFQNDIMWKKQTKSPFILYLDPVFMPVTKVNYIIEENPIDFSSQMIFLEIWTNGSLHPRKALQEALKKLVYMFFSFWEYQNTEFLKNKKNNKIIEKQIHTFFEI